jgi:EAL domain-containing protein (putative c-di-GMP-specific phosphodiesterase class I)/GGDEF domain-containing protein
LTPDNWPDDPAAIDLAASIAATLVRYGLDDRARSALRAYSAHDAGEAARRRRVDALEQGLVAANQGGLGRLHGLRHFADLFASLPEADFAADWLLQLADAWQVLRRHGGDEDMPLCAARALVAYGTHALLRGSAALSVLEVEIVGALSAAGMCAAELLCHLTALRGARTVIDDLSGLQRGTQLPQRLGAALAEAQGRVVGLMMLRLHLGPGTLTLSRERRDAVWEAALDRIRGLLRDQDLLVRTELHACAVLMPALQTHAQVMLASNKVAHALEVPLNVGGVAVRAMVAVGAVWSPAHGDSAEALIRCADLAVEAAEREEKAVVLFDDKLLAVAKWEAMIEKEFVIALDNGQLGLHVQPQVDLASGRCVGGELLLRWTDSEGRAVPPFRIPEVAKRIGAAAQLTRWLIFSTCRALAEMQRAGLDVRLSANLMGRDVMDSELPLLVEQAVSFWRVPPKNLTFELTEGMMLEDPAVGAEIMRRLIDLGVSTSIDDFGIGYSSILYLRQLPLHELKIDCAFVGAMSHSQQDREIVASLIQLAHALDLQVVAEGVEDEATLHLLQHMGCDRAQGYWIARAMPTADFVSWQREWNGRQSPASST